MSPNLQKSKTEALTVLRGAGSVKVRRTAFGTPEPSVQVASRHWPGSCLRIVPWYKHLGGILHHRAGPEREIRASAASLDQLRSLQDQDFLQCCGSFVGQVPAFPDSSFVGPVLRGWNVGRAH